ncbi:MAG TPA: phosphoribosylamine--glycine ligase, partial [Sutterella sp.]|nr:phosphoribosylamine--glycine ligase [Sutterella sp.]
EEASFIVMVDGEHVLAMASSQDHKRLLDGDKGPNTGGMGAYSPAPVVTKQIHEKVLREIIYPTVRGMKEEGSPYTGFLYAGLMINKTGDVKTLEFNCRFGDPETQPIMCRLKGNFAQAMLLALDGRLDMADLSWDDRIALGVVIAAKGYPENPEKGALIDSLPKNDATHRVFHAGTKLNRDGRMTVSGGRVLCVVGLGETFEQAQKTAYEAVNQVRFAGAQWRHDIGYRALAREGK